MPELRKASNAQILLELLDRHRLQRGPNRITWSSAPLTVIIGVGRDHHADVVIGDADYDALRVLVGTKADEVANAVEN